MASVKTIPLPDTQPLKDDSHWNVVISSRNEHLSTPFIDNIELDWPNTLLNKLNFYIWGLQLDMFLCSKVPLVSLNHVDFFPVVEGGL